MAISSTAIRWKLALLFLVFSLLSTIIPAAYCPLVASAQGNSSCGQLVKRSAGYDQYFIPCNGNPPLAILVYSQPTTPAGLVDGAYYRVANPQFVSVTQTCDPTLGCTTTGLHITVDSNPYANWTQISSCAACSTNVTPTPNPNVSLNPTSGPAGSTVTATGNEWVPGGQVINILWDGNILTETNADNAGNFTFSFSIPQDAPVGNHLIAFRDGNTSFEATISFAVIATPNPPPPDQSATSSISGRVTDVSGACVYGVKLDVTDSQGKNVRSGHTITNDEHATEAEYKMDGFPAGIYVVTPNKDGCTFTPPQADPATVPPKVEHQHFVGTPLSVPEPSSPTQVFPSGTSSNPVSIDYFALGDSIAAGHGLKGDAGDRADPCRRSILGYPHKVAQLLATQYEVHWTLLACSGAVTYPIVVQPRHKLLHLQVEDMLAQLSNRPTLVTITIGANDFEWASGGNFFERMYIDDDATFQKWVSGIISRVKDLLIADTSRLLLRRNIYTVITELYNPFNKSSVLAKGPNNLCGIRDCYAREVATINQFNQMLHDVEKDLNRPDRLKVAPISAAFQEHESPQPSCGNDLPEVSNTWIQYGDDPNSYSYPPYPVFVAPGRNWHGDCFHPNESGAQAIANIVGNDAIEIIGGAIAAKQPASETAPNSFNGAFADNAFNNVWERTDKPIASGARGLSPRSWLWGPQPITGGSREAYAEGSDGTRLVQYFDKSRMEINNPDAPRNQWYVTNGLLVVEMIEGRVQIGNTTYENRQPADEPVAGDPGDGNQNAPTYRTFRSVAYPINTQRASKRTGELVVDVLARDGTISQNTDLGHYNITLDGYAELLGHNIPKIFTNFFAQQGLVYEEGHYRRRPIFDWLFVMGLPISEPYWARVKVGGVEKDVLIQAFQRRILTYTPGNSPGFEVEMGNVGRHYLNWRYGH